MAVFPAIEPLQRSFDLGEFPTAVVSMANSDQTRFSYGTTAADIPVALEFIAITTAQAVQIQNHYLGQRDSQPFQVPVQLWRLYTDQFSIVPSTQWYVYAEPPQRSPRGGGLEDVTVTLATMP